MQSHVIRSLFLVVTLVAGITAAQSGSDAPAGPEGKKTCSKLLKGVVHLQNDDVRFARKGGGMVLVDPTSGPEDKAAIATGLVKPDLILITHPHSDHFQPAVLQAYRAANPQVVIAGPADVVKGGEKAGITGIQLVTPRQHYQLASFEFDTLPAYFTDAKANHAQSAQWVGYVLTLNGVRYYVTGDTQPLESMADAKADVVFPLLYGCGGNTEQALKMTRLTGAKVVVPVHHSGQLATIKKFLAQLPDTTAYAYYVGGTPSTAL